MAASAQLCSVSDVKQYLGMTDSAHDALITSLVNGASEAIENFCRRRFGEAEYTEYHDGADSALLLLDHTPVKSVDEVREGPCRDFEGCDPIDEDDYVLYPEEGLLLRTSGMFPRGMRNVRVVYTAGYSSVPAVVGQACAALVASWFNRGHQGGDGLESEQFGDYSAKYASRALPSEVTELLVRYSDLCV